MFKPLAFAICLMAAPSWANAEPLSVCANNRTEFPADVRVRALTPEGEFGAEVLRFSVEPHGVDCREWSEPRDELGVTARLIGAPKARRSLANGEWPCFQDSASELLDRLVWAQIDDYRSHGYEFVCANTHQIEQIVVIREPAL